MKTYIKAKGHNFKHTGAERLDIDCEDDWSGGWGSCNLAVIGFDWTRIYCCVSRRLKFTAKTNKEANQKIKLFEECQNG